MVVIDGIVEAGTRNCSGALIVSDGLAVTGNFVTAGIDIFVIPVILSECGIRGTRMVPSI